MVIRTKILATVGPATGSTEKICALVKAGCDALRINFSHGDEDQRAEFLRNIRQAETQLQQPVAVCGDLCGPKIRVGMMADGGADLEPGREIIIQREPVEGSADRISTTLPELIKEVAVGDAILLNDGRLKLEVIHTDPPEQIRCRIVRGGRLTSGKGVNLPHTDLSLSALTEKDRRDAAWIAQHDFDYVALSFVQRGEDVRELRRILTEHGSDAHIIAKIEKPQALARIDEILDAADVVMVARGDLGVEMDLPAVPVAQKHIAARAQVAGKPCIIATQMLESMIEQCTPTRAEVSDVANAVLDHADAVMLSGETAVGRYPVQAVEVMNETVEAIQAYHDETYAGQTATFAESPTTAAIARAVREIIRQEDIAAVAVHTATGATARMLAKNRLPCPVLALSPSLQAVRRMSLYYGVVARHIEATPEHTRDVLARAACAACELGITAPGQNIVVVSGRPLGKPGCTNTLVVHRVECEAGA